jgi:hypothetical protein
MRRGEQKENEEERREKGVGRKRRGGEEGRRRGTDSVCGSEHRLPILFADLVQLPRSSLTGRRCQSRVND